MFAIRSHICIALLSAACNVYAFDSYIAAVYEHVPIVPVSTDTSVTAAQALELMNKNMDILEPQIQAASKQVFPREQRFAARCNCVSWFQPAAYRKYFSYTWKPEAASIIVTPELAIFGWGFTRETVFPYLEDIPDPSVDWIPCSDPKRFGLAPVQQRLSCIAKNSSIYLVANIGDKKPCNSSDATCPKDGHFFYNTLVTFDTEGKLIARYHKYHLFYEDYFDKPQKPEYVFFDAPFGRVGLCTCFDMLFHDPPVALIEDYHVKHIVLPVAWRNVLPHLSAIEFFSAWAMAMGVNVLLANINNKDLLWTGSGVFQSNFTGSYYYNKDTEEGRLVTANVCIRPILPPMHSRVSWNLHATSIPRPSTFENEFSALVIYDNFTFTELKQAQGNYSVCHNYLCCHLSYSMMDKRDGEVYALGAFDGMHTARYPFYLQICTLLKCKTTDLQTCGRPTEESSTRFESFSLSGTFGTKYVFPVVLFNGTELGPEDFKVLDDGRLVSQNSFSTKPLITATLYGRWYAKDPPGV